MQIRFEAYNIFSRQKPINTVKAKYECEKCLWMLSHGLKFNWGTEKVQSQASTVF